MDALTVNRTIFTDSSTIGELAIFGEFFCHTLEDTCRRAGVKIYGRTAIPEGRYELLISPSVHYGRLMPRLVNVPGFDGILIHWGNKPADTLGCLLVGKYNAKLPNWISESRITFNRLFDRLTELKKAGPVFINVAGGRYRDERLVS